MNTDGTDGNADDPYDLEISRDRDGTEIKITDYGNMGDDDPKFSQAEDLGHGRTMHTREMEADDDGNVETEVVVVTTDIEAPEAVAFAEYETADGMTPQELNARDLDDTVDADGDGTNNNDFTALTVDGTSADVRALVESSSFTAGTASELRFAFDNTSTTDMDEADEVSGTYNGAMGTYRCNGGSQCTVTLAADADGDLMISDMSAGWVFTPDAGATSVQPDYEYLHYGFWLKRTADEDGVVTYNEVETFAGSSVAESGDVSSVTGTASYSGGATGVYVHTVSNSDGSRAQATSGHFTANASLTATFSQVNDADGVGTIAPNLLNTLTGTINNFDLSGGEDQMWSVGLEGDITASDGTVSADDWNATFHGPTGDANTDKPHSVVGEFNAGFTNGSVAGGFGARIEDD